MTDTFNVKNFDRFQHYKDRNPPWIKLFNTTLDDYEFGRLPDASKAHLIAIWLLASRYNNKIPYDAEWIARRINATSPVDLKILFDAGFIEGDQSCSKMLASRKQSALPETETETETEVEVETEEDVLRTSSVAVVKKPSTRGSRLPDDFEPDESCKALARELSFSVVRWSACLAEFRDYWKSIGGQRGVRIDWQATFRNRLRNFNVSGGKINGAERKSTIKGHFEVINAAIEAQRTASAGRAGERSEDGGDNLVTLPGLRENTA